jgi:hypothetical protein
MHAIVGGEEKRPSPPASGLPTLDGCEDQDSPGLEQDMVVAMGHSEICAIIGWS